jgi:hypothetical protein
VHICETKPRFILNDQGQLTLVPIPSLSASEYYNIQNNPGRYFHHEFFLPDGPSGLQMAKFPYLWGMIKASRFILKNLGNLDEISKYRYLYQPGHPSQALEVTTAIIKAFCDAAKMRGKRPVVMIIPTQEDMVYYQRHQKWSYQPLLDGLTASRLEYIDAGPVIAQQLNGADPNTLYDVKRSFHLNEEGNQLLAATLYDFLTSRNILGQIQ